MREGSALIMYLYSSKDQCDEINRDLLQIKNVKIKSVFINDTHKHLRNYIEKNF